MILRSLPVLVQIERVEDLLKRTGVRDYCTACVHSPEGGCCHGCEFLGPTGCTNKPLACALWLCSKARLEFPEVSRELSITAAYWPAKIAYGYREASIRAELGTI